MNCRRVSSLVSAYIDGELTGIEMLEIRRHLDDCRACMLQYESLRHTKQLLSRLTYAAPRAGLMGSICIQLDRFDTPAYQRLWNRVFGYSRDRFTPVAACCAAVCSLFVVLAFSTAKEPDIVAMHNPLAFASQLESNLTPAAFFSASGQDKHPLIPGPDREQMMASDMFTMVSLGSR